MDLLSGFRICESYSVRETGWNSRRSTWKANALPLSYCRPDSDLSKEYYWLGVTTALEQ